MPVTVGGGVRTVEDVRALMLAGADKVSINTAAVNDRENRRRGGGEGSAHRRSSWRWTPRRYSAPGETDRWGDLHPWRPQPHRP